MMKTASAAKAQRGLTEERRLRIGEVARESGVAVETLRSYERRGLLGRPTRTGANYRVYDATVLERLAFIKRAQAIGFSLDEITEILAESAEGRLPCHHVREMTRRKLGELDRRLSEMRRHRQELARVLGEWDERGEEEGSVCGLIEHSDITAPPMPNAAWGGGKRAGKARGK